MPELTSGRMFGAYGASMDAALADKANDIVPYLVPGLVVDRGCGTGAFMDYLAKKNWKVVGVEMSDALSKEHIGVISADINAPVFADGFASDIVLSSVLHEVYSYKGYSLYPVLACLANCARELRSGGRIIIRDIWTPPAYGLNNVRLTMTDDVADKLRDYEMKTPADPDKDNDLFVHNWVNDNCAEMSVRLAVEFLSKKEYTEHWDLECREIYTSVPAAEIIRMAESLGLDAIVHRTIRNHWIVENRWAKGVEIGWNGNEFSMFTNHLLVLEKP